jgi:hypothetical protein
MGPQEHALMLATIPRTFFPLHALANEIPPRTSVASPPPHDLRQKKIPPKSPPNGICRNAGEVGLSRKRLLPICNRTCSRSGLC